MNYGHLELRIEELLKERDISKNTICKELDIPRSNFNRYCRNEFQRLDANLICKLCDYFDCEAAKYIPLERLCLSPQCGFASCEIGNKLTEEEQWAKLKLVKEIAEEVWKDA